MRRPRWPRWMESKFVVGGLLWRCHTVENATDQLADRVPDLAPEVADTDRDPALVPVDEGVEADLGPEAGEGVKEVIPGRGPDHGLQDGLVGAAEEEVLPIVGPDQGVDHIEVEPEATRGPGQEVETEGVNFTGMKKNRNPY